MAKAGTILGKAGKLLEEEGLVSFPVPLRLKEPVEIQSGHEEPLVPSSFAT